MNCSICKDTGQVYFLYSTSPDYDLSHPGDWISCACKETHRTNIARIKIAAALAEWTNEKLQRFHLDAADSVIADCKIAIQNFRNIQAVPEVNVQPEVFTEE